MKVLTISIAAYNMEDYLETCLESLTDERIIDELEVFVVDDGSTDRTLEIARRYAERFPDSIFAIHKENGGYGTTVNYSIACASGKYFKILDADDWFDTDGLYRLVRYLENAEADLVVNFFNKGTDAANLKLQKYKSRSFGRDFLISDLDTEQVFSIWVISCRTSIVKESDVQLPGKLLYTDNIFISWILAKAKTICFLDYPVYCYRIGRQNQSSNRFIRATHAGDYMAVSKIVCDFCSGQKTNPNYKCILMQAARVYKYSIKSLMLAPISKENLIYLKKYEEEIRNCSKDVYQTATKVGRVGPFLWIMRRTRYLPYWFLKIIPGGVPNSFYEGNRMTQKY